MALFAVVYFVKADDIISVYFSSPHCVNVWILIFCVNMAYNKRMSFKDFKLLNDRAMMAEDRSKLVSPEIPAAVKPKFISNLDLGNDLE